MGSCQTVKQIPRRFAVCPSAMPSNRTDVEVAENKNNKWADLYDPPSTRLRQVLHLREGFLDFCR